MMAEEGFRRVCGVVCQWWQTTTFMKKLTVRGIYSLSKASRRIHTIAPDIFQVSGI
jgi:hypothetical protein